MILITKGTNNTVVFTLQEKTTLPNANYLFEFISTQTKVSKTCVATDTSEYKDRFNSFEIIERANANGLLAEVELDAGFWQYKVYSQSLATNLDTALTHEVVETGLAYVVGTGQEKSTYNQQPTNAFVYNG